MTRPMVPYGTTYVTIEPEPVFVSRSHAEKIALMKRFRKQLHELGRLAKRPRNKRKTKHRSTR